MFTLTLMPKFCLEAPAALPLLLRAPPGTLTQLQAAALLPAHRRQELRFPTVVPAGALPGRPPSPPEHLTSNL